MRLLPLVLTGLQVGANMRAQHLRQNAAEVESM